MPRWLKHVTVWLLIGTAVYVALQWSEAQRQQRRIVTLGQAVLLERGRDGHYHWPGRVGGERVDLLVDTGATRTALPLALARRLNLPLTPGPVSQTAGGAVAGWVTQVDVTLDGGPSIRNLRVGVLPALGTPLLGMDVLGRLSIHQEGGRMRIAPPAGAR